MRPIIRVMGVGSPHGDDQFGWRLVERLASRAIAGLEAIAIASPVDLIDHLDGCVALVVVDACRSGRPPGTVMALAWPDARIREAIGPSTHGVGVASALALAGALGRLPPRVVVFAVEAEAEATATAVGLSPALRRAMSEVLSRLRKLVAGVWGPAGSPGPAR